MARSALLSVRIVADGKDAQRGLDNVSAGVGRLDGKLKAVKSPMSKVTSLIGGIGKVAAGTVKAVGAVALGVAALAVKGGIERALAIEGAQAKLKGLGHSTKSVTAVMDSALASVKGTAYGLGDAAKVAANVVAAGVKPGADLTRTLKLVADTATIAGTGMDEMGSIFNKVAASGKVTTDVINQLQDRGVPAFDLLAKSMHKTVPEVQDLVKKGKIGFAEFQAAMEKGVGGAALKTGDTTAGAFANMKAALSRFGLVLAGGFFPLFKDIFNQITLILDGLNTRLKPFSDAFAATFQAKAGPIIAAFAKNTLAFFDEIGRGFTAFSAAWAANDGDVTSSGFPGFMERVANAARAVQSVFQKLDFSSFAAFTASLGAAGGAAGANLGSIGESMNALMPAFQAFIAESPKITGALVKLGGLSLNVLTVALSFLADHVDTIIKFMPAIVAGFVLWKLASGATAAAQLRVNAAQVAMVPVTTANNILRLIAIRQENQLALATGARTASTNAGLGAMLRQKAAMVATTAVMLAQKAAMAVATAAQWLFNAAMSANPVMLIVLGIIALVAAVILAYNKIGWFKDFVNAVFAGIKVVIGAVVEWFKTAWNVAIIAVGAYIGFWIRVFQAAIAVAVAVITAVVTWFTTAWNNAVAAGAGIIQGFRDTVANVFDGIKSTIQTVVSVVQDSLGAAFQTAASLASGAMDTITAAIDGVIGWIQDAIGWVGRLFGKANSGGAGGGGATSVARYIHSPATALDFPGGATGFALSPASFAIGGPAPVAQVTNINVNISAGVGDPVSIGREVDKVLTKFYRATGKTGGTK